MPKKSDYQASNIQVLEGLEAVRKRPAMYIGSTDRNGLHHIFTEILDNSVDEAIAGYCSRIWVTLELDGSISVKDNGRGIPVEIHPQTKVSTLETVMTNLHAGGKFDDGAYKVSGGLHGVGMKCTNALSEWMITTVTRDGGIYRQEYKRGIPQAPVKKVGSIDDSITGTEHRFLPDDEIFSETTFDFKEIIKKCRQHAYLTAGLRITVKDLRVEQGHAPKIFDLYFEDGIKSYVLFMNIDEKFVNEQPFYVNKENEGVLVEAAIQYTNSMDENVKCYTNNIINPEGGTHLAGFRTALTSAINTYAQKSELLKGLTSTLNGDDVREGLTAVISVKVANPQFEGQTKIKLNNPEVKNAVAKVIRDELLIYFDEHPKEAKAIIDKAILSYKAKAAAKAARDAVIRKSALESTALPGKLADCISSNPADSELYIVEGDSAGGSAKQGRDRHTQAVLPLRGKIINTHKYRVDRVLGNNEFKDITTALGVGIGTTLDIAKLRYHKIVIMSDADVDGLHITTLVLTLLYRFFKPLIDGGYVYVAQPPLHKVEIGKKKYYFLNDNEKDEFVRKAKAAGKVPVSNRFKGLGEMNPGQLWETTMSPETRVLKQVKIDDAEEAEKVFEMLMGTEVPPRRRFIQKYAKRANLDV
ncbi:MAG: gyrase subunit B, DNA gyrase subunit B protein [candidate division WS6 bacterium GW2011_GWC1_33_20]|uniref:DNA topoisomerase (ATP-hydrolyzing) n=2 Tax=Candidatus Dojkabacteria TaxID=74243 RepID=A0A0G0AFU4_9BACT|nr:MAG: gyrase subunit B, DNA gyrase subunit B protein [candidate division WS6 bacterium GW2011_GWE2_33_157]KKP44385.1 MAG: gyrase subunit B, DNA gyrase subunit B protein [candidate division WS6 bacterium GW2011_GWC1_33_20]KKP46015.1 MAG: gyrase subunit B, DNA gyrase subunit B protein [candidate division WS6 bacterium GW2011_GWF1_33_233]KKP55473.1 MAG: gyrase subunit B protein [candidate division WS6 bacterium GW2011_GWB1_33_6]KKP55553.1 MAG: gyrase subunit B, DNA gyrase subunit B protein [cand